VYLRIKRERVSGFQRDIKGFVSAFYISKTGIYRFFVNNGKLVDGGYHDFNAMTEYLYNALPLFFTEG
jgi:hypothetical protein